jgi:ketol-acid reductoisomerase
MRYSVSDTAEWGDYKSGPRIVTDQTREAMRQILKDIQSGAFAEEWMDEYRAHGAQHLKATRKAEQNQQIEQVGKQLRGMMTFLNAKEVN